MDTNVFDLIDGNYIQGLLNTLEFSPNLINDSKDVL